MYYAIRPDINRCIGRYPRYTKDILCTVLYIGTPTLVQLLITTHRKSLSCSSSDVFVCLARSKVINSAGYITTYSQPIVHKTPKLTKFERQAKHIPVAHERILARVERLLNHNDPHLLSNIKSSLSVLARYL